MASGDKMLGASVTTPGAFTTPAQTPVTDERAVCSTFFTELLPMVVILASDMPIQTDISGVFRDPIAIRCNM